MRRLPILLACLIAGAAPAAGAREVITRTVITETVEEEAPAPIETGGSDRFVAASTGPGARAAPVRGAPRFGPFRVLGPTSAALVGATDSRSPAAFAAMLRAYPAIAVIEMIECPGTDDDQANLALGRMIHARGIATHVPAGGSVRSGAVELFLAGRQRMADPRAEFAVHSWIADDGRQAADFAPDGPENRAYIDYYRDMGMSEGDARRFYAMTNSVPNAEARWLSGAELALWVPLD